jgi:hypothetical protein
MIRHRDITLRLPVAKLNTAKMQCLSVWCDTYDATDMFYFQNRKSYNSFIIGTVPCAEQVADGTSF